MLVKNAPDIRSSEITDKKLYLRRRECCNEVLGDFLIDSGDEYGIF